MRARRPTLVRRLAGLVSLGLGVVWIVAVLTMALVLSREQDELYDQQLRISAETLLPVLSHEWQTGMLSPGTPVLPERGFDPNESLLWRLVDRDGEVLAVAPSAPATAFAVEMKRQHYRRSATHVVYMTDHDASGLAVQFAAPLAERSEAWRDTFLAFLLPMLAILPLGYMLVRWITAKGLQPLDEVRAELAQRDSQSLSPMDTSAHPAELSAIIATLNSFMARLSQALEGERAFASNAAHELRTPVAVALAQVQRMQIETSDETQAARLVAIEQALRRMSRLVARLLQLARAQSGLGLGAAPIDVKALLPHILRDGRGIGVGAGVHLELPPTDVISRMDADALAIVLGNLIDNSLQHAPAGTPVDVTLTAKGTVLVRNDGPVVPAADLARLADRFASRRAGGFGLGLHIAQQITQQAGGRLVLASPIPGRDDGFEARLDLP